MVEFRTMYYGPMDREYHQAITESPQPAQIEEPILPVSQLGETVPEHDPSGRFKNIIQTTQAAIRGGAGTLQIVLMTPPESAIGGRPKAYGKEVRETLKEVALASQVNIAGVELPTALNNLAGFDYQQLVFSEDKRKQSLDEVRDAIRFVADVARGGGVDIVSWEFPRGVNEAPWQKTDKLSAGKFEQVGEQRIGWLVDDRTGRTVQFRKDEIQHIPWRKDNFKKMEPKEEEFKRAKELGLSAFTWDDFVRWAETESKEKGKTITPEEKYIEVQLQGQINSLLGWRTTYLERANEIKGAMDKLPEREKLAQTKEDKTKLEEEKKRLEVQYHDFLNSAYGQAQQAKELEERKEHLKPIEQYAVKRSAITYAEAGVEAMRTTQQGMQKGTITKDVYVGPEIGWPGYYGSHPEEFINLVKSSRKEMKNLLTNKYIDPKGNFTNKEAPENKQNRYFDPNINQDKAEELAKRHVKGLFDTSHMGMWLAHFKPETDPNTGILETEDRRIKRFNKWYTEQVKKIADAGVVGGIQLVDSMSAAHGHLPPGEGIFPVMDTAKIFKDKGFKGFMVSEGHEEEKFGEGRIRMKTWQHAGAPVGAGYFSGPPLQWGRVSSGYFGKTYSPMFMFGGYAPSNEFKLWSEVPLE